MRQFPAQTLRVENTWSGHFSGSRFETIQSCIPKESKYLSWTRTWSCSVLLVRRCDLVGPKRTMKRTWDFPGLSRLPLRVVTFLSRRFSRRCCSLCFNGWTWFACNISLEARFEHLFAFVVHSICEVLLVWLNLFICVFVKVWHAYHVLLRKQWATSCKTPHVFSPLDSWVATQNLVADLGVIVLSLLFERREHKLSPTKTPVDIHHVIALWQTCDFFIK